MTMYRNYLLVCGWIKEATAEILSPYPETFKITVLVATYLQLHNDHAHKILMI